MYFTPDQTVIMEYFLSILKHFRDTVRRKIPEIWTDNFLILHENNAPLYLARIVLNYLPNIDTIEKEPYSPVMSSRVEIFIT